MIDQQQLRPATGTSGQRSRAAEAAMSAPGAGDVDPERVQKAILEYLKFYEFVHSAECLEAELERKRLTAQGARARRRGNGGSGKEPRAEDFTVAERILTAFDAGDEDVFAFLWSTKIDERDRDVDLARHIEFDVRLYLAVFHVLDHGTSAQLETEARMRTLKRFLDTRGRALASDPACCCFYALPLCAAPQEHSVFSQLFDDTWRRDLRARLAAFLDLNAREGARPELCDLYASGDRPRQSRPDHSNAPENHEGKAAHGDENLPALCKEIYATAVQAVELLERARQLGGAKVQKAVSEKYMNKLMRSMQRFADRIDGHEGRDPETLEELDMTLFQDNDEADELDDPAFHARKGSAGRRRRRRRQRQHSDDVSDSNSERERESGNESDGGSVDDRDDANSSESKQSFEALVPAKPVTLAKSPQSPKLDLDFQAAIECPVLAPLDYALLKSDLDQLADRAVNEPMAERQACLVLQALRWRLSRTPSSMRRANVLAKYVENDVLGVKVGDGERVLLKALLTSDSSHLREYTIRLLSYIAMGRAGRAYLFRAKDIVVTAVWDVLSRAGWKFPRKGRAESSNLEAALCTLQRLSLDPRFAAEIHARPCNPDASISTVAFFTDLLNEAQRRSDFVNEHIAALALNLSIAPGAASKLDREETCLRTLEALLSESSFAYLHEYAAAILFAMLRAPKAREALADRAGSHFALLRDLASGANGAHGVVAREIRQQLLYIVELIESDGVEEAVNAEEKQALALEDEVKRATTEDDDKADHDQDQDSGARDGDDALGDDIPPEDDASELPDFRESAAPTGSRQGEHLLVYAYSTYYQSPSKTKEPRSPILKLVDSLRLPEELTSKPRLVNTPGAALDAPFHLGNDDSKTSEA